MQWNVSILGNTLTDWAIALGIALGVMVATRTAIRLLLGRLRALARRTENDLDDLFTELLAKTRWLAVLLIGLWAGSLYLELSDDVDAGLRHVLYIGVLFQGALWVSGIVNYLLQRYRNAQVEEDPGLATALGAVGFIARTGVWATFLLMALANLGMDITALVTSLGIGGVAIALALQNVLGDLFASLSIVFDKPFQVGDFIQVGEFRGTVEHVGLKTTRIRALEGEQLVFGNSDLLGSRIRNYKRRVERRCAFTIGLTYDTPPDKVARVPDMIREIVESHEVARFDRSHFLTFGDFSLNVETVYYLKDPDYMVYADCQQAINLELMRRFAEEGIEFAFPTQTIMLQRVDPATG